LDNITNIPRRRQNAVAGHDGRGAAATMRPMSLALCAQIDNIEVVEARARGGNAR
jgi:hypothetical protein